MTTYAKTGSLVAGAALSGFALVGPLAMIGVAARLVTVTGMPDAGYDSLDVRDPIATGISGFVAVFALCVGLRMLGDAPRQSR